MKLNSVQQYTQKGSNNDKIIAIITDCGTDLGMGHLQRMMSLLWYLNQKNRMKAYLISDSIPDNFPQQLLQHTKKKIDFKPDLIIRDKRNSSIDEISMLKEISRVLVIDDNGDGRDLADHVIDLLPNPDKRLGKTSDQGHDLFIYGYNFFGSLKGINKKRVEKNIDFTIYPGYQADKEYISFLISLLPEKSNHVILNWENLSNHIDGRKNNNTRSYSELILSSRIIISHFGIMLYEGFISGCRLISINRSSYHSKLTDMVKDDLCITNLGEYKSIDKIKAKRDIDMILSNSKGRSISIMDVLSKVEDGLERFYRYLQEKII